MVAVPNVAAPVVEYTGFTPPSVLYVAIGNVYALGRAVFETVNVPFAYEIADTYCPDVADPPETDNGKCEALIVLVESFSANESHIASKSIPDVPPALLNPPDETKPSA